MTQVQCYYIHENCYEMKLHKLIYDINLTLKNIIYIDLLTDKPLLIPGSLLVVRILFMILGLILGLTKIWLWIST